MKVLSLNVYYGRMRDGLASYIASRSPDVSIFCFQETDAPTRELLDSHLLDEFVGFHDSKTGDGDIHYVSLYVRRSLDVIEIRKIMSDDERTGLALQVEVVDKLSRHYQVYSVYGTPRPGDKLDSIERLALSKKLVDLASRSSYTQVIAGDFNLLPDTESVQMFADSGFRNLIEEFEIPTTRNEIAWSKFPAHMKQLHADYAFVRGEGVDCSLTVEDVRVSDHLPLVVSLTQKAPSAEILDSVSEPSRARLAV